MALPCSSASVVGVAVRRMLREHARVHVQLDERHDHAEVDAIGEAVLEHGREHVAIDVDADLLLEQIALEVRGEIGELAGVGVRAAAVVVLEDERQVAVLEVDAVDLTVVERLLAEAEREHALAEGGGALGERRSRHRAGDLLGVVEMPAPRRRLREGRDLLGDADVQQRRHARQVGADDERAA